jgi:hypothetical protein
MLEKQWALQKLFIFTHQTYPMILRISKLYILLNLLVSLTSEYIFGQGPDAGILTITPRQNFYSYESDIEFLVAIPKDLSGSSLSLKLNTGETQIGNWEGVATGSFLRIPCKITLSPGVYRVDAEVAQVKKPLKIYTAGTDLVILKYKPNEVKTDKLTGGLIVNKRQFFPFGFYCYFPVYPTLPEEEVVKGFNMISPYQKIEPETMAERKAYMDRCAELGMKVHYNLLSVSGGGGVGSKIEGLSDSAKRVRLKEEIETFRDHPALLGWYISDEPNGYKIEPSQLEEIYKTVKKLDPWHPASIVFMAPFLNAKKYEYALDIVMADPYPVPNLPLNVTGDVTENLSQEFRNDKPVWIVPQAFGGGELWQREPTRQEVRSMTWQAIIKGATGIQYFVRQGMNYFPKSAAMWAECGQMATEVAELTPWILSDEERIPVSSSSKNISVTSRVYKGKMAIIAVNTVNEPVSTTFRFNRKTDGKARVLFENRIISVKAGSITDQLASYGSQVYLIDQPENSKPIVKRDRNLLMDGGFEDLTEPGLPSACYARPGGDRGATYFLDSGESYEGIHSLRIVTPAENKSVAIRFFPITVRAGASYTISLRAKCDPERRITSLTDSVQRRNQDIEPAMPQLVEIQIGEFKHATFVPDSTWKEYMTFVTIPKDTLAHVKTNLILRMPGKGVAWFDDIKILEDK